MKTLYNDRARSEKGQALVLLTLGIVTLLGFAALAMDGGRVYAQERTIQGVADSSSMTGALYIAQNLDMMTSSIKDEAQAAALQHAVNEGDSGEWVTTVSITEDDYYYYIETLISGDVELTLGKIIMNDDIGVAARSIARVPKTHSFALGQAFYALSEDACPAINHSGNLDVIVDGSGIYSNSTCSSSININSAAANETFSGNITAAGGIDIHHNAGVSASGVTANASQNSFNYPDEPDCSGLSSKSVSHSDSVISPGIYSSGIHLSGNRSLELEPGLYCLDGDLQIDNGTFVGEGVTFFMRGSSDVHINGGDITLAAPQDGQVLDVSGNELNGMLIFQAYGNNSELKLNGNADSYFEGTVFVPDANCQINGTGTSVALDMQVVCDTIEFIGTADLYIDYDDSTKVDDPIILDLYE